MNSRMRIAAHIGKYVNKTQTIAMKVHNNITGIAKYRATHNSFIA